MSAHRIQRPATAFAMGAPKGPKRARPAQRQHTAFIRSLPCCVCGSRKQVEAAHVRSPSAAHGKQETGTSQRPEDIWTVPLCRAHHQDAAGAQHQVGEAKFWSAHQIDPFTLALALWAATGDDERADAIVREAIARARGAHLSGADHG